MISMMRCDAVMKSGKSSIITVILAIFFFVVLPAHADIPRIQQGDIVYLNDIVDISGVTGWDNRDGGSNYIAYCGGFNCYGYDNPFLLKLPPRTRTPDVDSQYRFLIDPEIFSKRSGEWYQFDEDDDAEHGNMLAFVVMAQYRNVTETLKNGTVVVSEVNATEHTLSVKPRILPDRPISDVVIARGDSAFIETRSPAKIWMFGRVDSLYDIETKCNNITIPANTTSGFEPGSYILAIQHPGKNTEYDIRYSKEDDLLQWKYGWSRINSISLAGISPKVAKDRFYEIIGNTDDEVEFVDVEIQDPSITIEGFTEVPMYYNFSRYEEYRLEKGTVTLFDVRGYTNAINGTEISVTLDESRYVGKDIKRHTFYTTAVGGAQGNLSVYQVYVPIVWDDMTIGTHTLVARNTLGAEMIHDFPISILPEDSFRPNATVKYALDRNPWIPTPTPEVITTVVTKEIVIQRTVEIPVTPTNEQVANAQFNAVVSIVLYGVAAAIVCAVVLAAGWYAASVYLRSRRKP